MADDIEPTDPLNLAVPAEKPRLRKRALRLDPDDVVDGVLIRVEDAQDERQTQMTKRRERNAKVRGWTQREDPPWDGASNHHWPVMMANALRVKAGLFNAVTGIRPMMTPKVLRRDLKEAAEKANDLIDYQLFVEFDGEQAVTKYIDQFVDDPAVFSFQPWARDSNQTLYDVRVFPRPDRPLIEEVADLVSRLYPRIQELTAETEDGMTWSATYTDDDGHTTPVTIEVYDKDDDKIELCVHWTATVFDGPVMIVDDLEDIVVPMRGENPQPVTPQNPKGVPWIARLSRITLDELKRGQRDGIYDLLPDPEDDPEDVWGKLDAAASGRVPTDQTDDEDALKADKDRAAGIEPQRGAPRHDKQWLTLIQWFGGWDMNDDGLNEEVIFWVVRDARVVIRAKYLTELYPGSPPRRPFSHACYIPVPGQMYGICLHELQEGLHDFLHIMLNQMTDNGDLANRPFGFYRGSSGIKPETVQLWPGDLYPVDNPQQDVFFPSLPQRDQTFGFNMVALAKQFLDDVTQIGPIQKGQVPQGKASALRTLGTTMAILQQGAAMPEQVLRRLFGGLRQVWEQFHLLNTRFLKKRKQYLASGKLQEHEDPYREIADPQDIAIPVSWDWQPTLLNTNKGLVQQALQAIGMAVFNPLSFQLGTTGPEEYFNWQKDLIQAGSLDPLRYIKRPPGVVDGPKILAEEAILQIISGQPIPQNAGPAEPNPQEHLAKFQQWMQGDDFGLLLPAYRPLLMDWLGRVTMLMQQLAQAQAIAGAAQEFSTTLGNQGEGQGSQPTMGEPPGVQAETGSADELAGATLGSR